MKKISVKLLFSLLLNNLLVGFIIANTSLFLTLEEYLEKLYRLKMELLLSKSIHLSIEQAKEHFPKQVTIQGKNFRFEVSNEWLLSNLDKISNSDDDLEKEILISETIQMIDSIIFEIERIQTDQPSKLTKDESKKKLEEILSRPDYLKPEKRDSNILEKLIDRLLEWLRQNSPHPLIPAQDSNIPNAVLQILIVVLLIGLTGLLLHQVFSLYFKKHEILPQQDTIILGEELSKNDTPKSLFAEAESLAKEGKLRLAVRKAYISMLYELANRKILKLSKNKTNRDYLKEIKRNTKIYTSFNMMTENFERAWYGLGEPTNKDWEDFKNAYLETLRQK